MAENTRKTTDHATIRRWAEERGGRPAHVRSTSYKREPGVLSIVFRDQESSLETISWNDFFEHFEERNLAFEYEDETSDGRKSRSFKFVDRSPDR